jgi:hypothetical protein
VELLAEGDLALFGEISQDVEDVPAEVTVGEKYVSCGGHVNWYVILEPPREGCVFVRVFSFVFRRGDYDNVSVGCLAARVSPRLFERARANGFRSIRAFS